MIESFLNELEQDNFLSSFEAYKHHLDKMYNMKEICHYATIRNDTQIELKMTKHLEKIW